MITTKEIQEIFNYWNSQKIVVHRILTPHIKGAINARLRNYTELEIKESINNYRTVLSGTEYWFTYRWTLKDFLSRGGWERFLAVNCPLQSFKINRTVEITLQVRELGLYWLKTYNPPFMAQTTPEGINAFLIRNHRALNEILAASGNSIEKAKGVIKKAGNYYQKQGLSWTLNTVAKNLPEFVI